MDMRGIMRTALAVILSLAALTAFGQERRSAVWLGGPLVYETSVAPKMTLGVGLAPVVVREDDSFGSFDTTTETVSLGLAIEGFYYRDQSLSGLALGLRLGQADGHSYLGPGVYYVSRPSRKSRVAFRFGAVFPLGKDVVPFVPEVAIGFQF